MTVVVTGAAGFVGSHLCERLVAGHREVHGIDAFTRFYARSLKEANLAGLRAAPAFRLSRRNLLAYDRLAADLRGADALCHLAGRPGVRGGAPPIFEAGNVRTTEMVLRAAAAAGVRRVVLASSSSVYGPATGAVAETAVPHPLSPYGRSKRRAERVAAQLARRLGIELVTLRLFTVYGPRQRPDMAFARFTRAALAGQAMPLLGDGRQRRDFTYAGDAAAALELAIDRGRPGGVYNVSGGRPVALADALALLARELGTSPRLQERAPDPSEPRATAADLSLARAELGYEPRVSLEEGITRQADHARAAAAAAA